ncbi:MAG: SusC/RagA family TonB-linked outer membrane protein [Bacteroidetes bacterium]|nr:SusC/RagA family TonB-linked outer membrane protein [Bacteroidota bacterium]
MKLKFDYLTKCLLLLTVALGMSSLAMAQRTIKGTVTDGQTGDALIGANILVIGTSAGTITDIDGTYELQVPSGATELEFTYTGYAAQKVTLSATNVYDVAMDAGALLDEVVVVGYGSVRKSDLTGSVVSVGEDDFNKGLVTSPDQLIQGKAAGVQILNNSGQPGGATTVRIRGNSSIRAGNQPLFVLDGVQLTGNSTRPGTNVGETGNNGGSNPLTYLNPADIESIQVLKDASATAIYGSRGANGVIIITTKRGRTGAPSVSFNASLGASTILNKYDVLDGNEYRAALTEYGLTGGDYNDNVDAFDEILQTGLVQNHSVSISGGADAGTYRLSLGYLNQEGIIKNNDLKRISANLAGSYKFLDSKRLGLDFNLIASNTGENGPSISTSAGFRGSLIGNALQWNPTHALYNADGSPIIVPQFGNFTNPVALLNAYHDKSSTVDIIASVAPSYRLTDNLTYKLAYSVTNGRGTRRAYIDRFINLQDIENRGVASVNEENNTNQILTHTLTWVQDIAQNVSLNAVAGYEYQKLTEKGFGISARDFLVEDFDYTNILQNTSQGSRDVYAYQPPDAELQSYFVQANINIRNKYLLTGTFRADGSSKFGENNKYGYFPAVGAAWNLHNESFLEDGLFDQLKLRLAWGKTGNSEFPTGASLDQYAFGQQSIYLENTANPDLKWEESTTMDVGLDFALLDYRITGTIDYFNKTTEDLLFQQRVIVPAPSALFWTNLPGEVVNKGVEVTLNATVLNNENLNWDLGVNLAFLSNELNNYKGANLLYGEVFGQGSSGATINRIDNGVPLNAFYTRNHLGIGDSGQSEYEGGAAETHSYLGDPNPDVLLGISTSVSMGKISLGLNFNGAMGHDIFNNTKMSVLPIGNLGTRNIDATLLDGDVQEAISNPIKASSRYLEDGSYVKLANATLAYNLGNLGSTVKNARIYLTGQNLLVFTNFTGFDPEVNTVNVREGLPSTGIEYIPYPSARTIIFGVNFSF